MTGDAEIEIETKNRDRDGQREPERNSVRNTNTLVGEESSFKDDRVAVQVTKSRRPKEAGGRDRGKSAEAQTETGRKKEGEAGRGKRKPRKSGN